MARDAVWDEACALGVDMTIAQTALAMGVEPPIGASLYHAHVALSL